MKEILSRILADTSNPITIGIGWLFGGIGVGVVIAAVVIPVSMAMTYYHQSEFVMRVDMARQGYEQTTDKRGNSIWVRTKE